MDAAVPYVVANICALFAVGYIASTRNHNHVVVHSQPIPTKVVQSHVSDTPKSSANQIIKVVQSQNSDPLNQQKKSRTSNNSRNPDPPSILQDSDMVILSNPRNAPSANRHFVLSATIGVGNAQLGPLIIASIPDEAANDLLAAQWIGLAASWRKIETYQLGGLFAAFTSFNVPYAVSLLRVMFLKFFDEAMSVYEAGAASTAAVQAVLVNVQARQAAIRVVQDASSTEEQKLAAGAAHAWKGTLDILKELWCVMCKVEVDPVYFHYFLNEMSTFTTLDHTFYLPTTLLAVYNDTVITTAPCPLARIEQAASKLVSVMDQTVTGWWAVVEAQQAPRFDAAPFKTNWIQDAGRKRVTDIIIEIFSLWCGVTDAAGAVSPAGNIYDIITNDNIKVFAGQKAYFIEDERPLTEIPVQQLFRWHVSQFFESELKTFLHEANILIDP